MNQEAKRREVVLDPLTDRIGEVMERIPIRNGVRVYLRPRGGGREWSTDGEVLPVPSDMEPGA